MPSGCVLGWYWEPADEEPLAFFWRAHSLLRKLGNDSIQRRALHSSVGEGSKEPFSFSPESGSLQVKGCSGSCQHPLLSSESAFFSWAIEKSGKSPSDRKLNSYKLGWLLSSSHPFLVCDESTWTLPDKKFQNIWHKTSHHCLPWALEFLFHE